MKKLINVLLITTIFISYVSISFAETPDGVTPAEESICDILLKEGHNENVWGICNAFCEAKDCDSQKIFDKSCSQLLKNFIKKTNNKIPLPCLPDNFCTDHLGNYYTNVVEKGCESVTDSNICSISFTPFGLCEKIGDDTSGCVWDPITKFCLPGAKISEKYCCTDSFELNPEPIELRTNREGY